jgi:hypothetical protein
MSAALEQVEYVSTQSAIPMRRVWAMPSANTFDIPPIRALVKSYLYGSKVSVDPFARNKRWATHTNDLNPDTAAEHHLPASDFLKMLFERGVRADFLLFDPPYSPGQAKEVYQSIGIEKLPVAIAQGWTTERDLISKLLLPKGVAISFGWNSTGIGMNRGFRIEEIMLVAHGKDHNDTICTVERKVESAQQDMFSLVETA